MAAFLDDYVDYHFGAEERLMASHGYPELARHKELHAHFRREFTRLKSTLGHAPMPTMLAVQLNHLLVAWFTDHICNQDRKFAEFIDDSAAVP